MPYEIADAMVPRKCDAAEGRDVMVAILGVSLSSIMHPEWHNPESEAAVSPRSDKKDGNNA